jgi:epoxyqueuosine reductase
LSDNELEMNGTIKTAADTAWIAKAAQGMGFDLCGVARPEKFAELQQAEEWLERGYAGEMKYLSDARRSDLHAVMAGVESVVVCAINYNSERPYSTDVFSREKEESSRGWISRYAWGSDYHEVMWGKLNLLVAKMRERFSEPFEARASADTGPIPERVLAKHAGLGWIGKNTLLLNQKKGSWLFLGTILTSLELEPTIQHKKLLPPDLCGTCRKCIEACPTDALVEPYLLDARRCISYLTIELRGPIPVEFREQMGSHVFGCDICQDVCPWNRNAPRTAMGEFQPREADGSGGSLFYPKLEWLASLGEAEYQQVFRGSAMKRTKWRGLLRNACNAIGNSGLRAGSNAGDRALALLRRLVEQPDLAVKESAQWAISRIEQVSAIAARL